MTFQRMAMDFGELSSMRWAVGLGALLLTITAGTLLIVKRDAPPIIRASWIMAGITGVLVVASVIANR